jgi:hypothetical protein
MRVALSMLKDPSWASLILVLQAEMNANGRLIHLGTDAFEATLSRAGAVSRGWFLTPSLTVTAWRELCHILRGGLRSP